MNAGDVTSKLASVRGRLRLLLAVDGAARLIAATGGVFAGLAALDWWVHFPPLIRLGFLAGGCVWIAGWSFHRVWRPLTAPIALDQLALALTVLTPDLRDRLAASIAYLRSGGAGSDDLWKGLVSGTAQTVGKTQLLIGLNPRRPAKSMLAVIAVFLSMAGATWAKPGLARIGWRRIVHPLAVVEWPRRTQIETPATESLVAHGEPFTASMRLLHGDDPDVRGYATWRMGDRPAERAMMRRDADGVYRRVIESVTADITYSFSAGDDDTADRPCRVKVVRRPTVVSARFVFTPPPYAKHLPQREQSLTDARASAIRGSRARLEVISDKELRMGDRGSSRIVFEGGRELALAPVGGQQRVSAAEFAAEASCGFDIVLVDEQGFESRGGPRYQLDVAPDQPPTVVIVEPTGAIDVLPEAAVDVSVQATDDLGVEELTLRASTRGGEWGVAADLLSGHSGANAAPSTRVTAEYPWSLPALRLAPGDIVEYVAQARDGFRRKSDVSAEPETHKPARSQVMRLNVVSAAQFSERLRQEVSAMRGQLRKLLAGLEAMRSQTASLDHRKEGAFDEGNRAEAERLVEAARRWIATGRDTARQIERVARRADMNKAADIDPAKQASRLSRRLLETVEGTMNRAVSPLAEWAQTRSPAKDRGKLGESLAAQEQALASLRAMLDEVEHWDSFDEIVRKLHEVIDRQEALTRDVAVLGRSQATAESSPDWVRAASEQLVLGDETAKMIAAMEPLAKQLHASDRAASDRSAEAESLDRARMVAGRQGLTQVMADAAEAIRAARSNEAAQTQERAASTLRAMLVALNDKPRRELELLSRNARDARQRLLKLIAAQEELMRRNRAVRAADSAAVKLADLGDRQASLESTTRDLSGQLNLGGPDADEAKDDIVSAADQMNTAATLLRDAAGAEAEDAQKGALGSLQSALAALERLEEKTMTALAEKSMAAIVDALKELRRGEAAIRDETSTLASRCKGRAGIPRAEGLAMNRLARQQRGLAETLGEVRQKIAKAVVYDFVCDRIGAAMESSATLLTSHDAGAALEPQERILRELGRLIDAVEEPPNRDEARYASEEGGGGGKTNMPTPTSPVPTLAELKLLRLMQSDVNDQTVSLNARLPDALLRSEEQLKRIDALGADQRRIHELAVKMIQKAESGGRD